MTQELTPDIDVSTLKDDPSLCHVIQMDHTMTAEDVDPILDELGAQLPESGVVALNVSLDSVDSLTADELREVASRFEAQADAMDSE